MSTESTLGYHELGQFHFFTALPESARSLGATGSFQTHESFLSLLTALHETYHVMQDLFLGVCCWMAERNVEVGECAVQGVGHECRGATTALALDDTFLHRLIYSSEITRSVVKQEMRNFPSLGQVLGPTVDLTGQDLLECHAAILTELAIARLMLARPDAFDARIVGDLEPLFRVDKMLLHRRALDAFQRTVGRFTDFRPANASHPLYPHCPRAAEYTLVAFLLDLALHVAPMPYWTDDDAGLLPLIQDTYPTCRYLKLLFTLPQCWMRSMKRGENLQLDEETLYTTLANDLAHRVMISSLYALAANRGTRGSISSSMELVDLPRNEILIRLRLEDPGDSFPPFEAATDAWLTRYGSHPWAAHFPRLYGVRLRALRLRRDTPWLFLHLAPCVFYPTLGIPGFFQTSEAVEMMPPAFVIRPPRENEGWDSPPEDMAFSSREFIPEGPNNPPLVLETVGLPHGLLGDGFLDQVAAHEVALSIAGMLVHGEPMRCALTTEKLRFYDCQGRTASCQRICDLESLPSAKCLAQTVLRRLFIHDPTDRST